MPTQDESLSPPNIILVLCDDMGFSDIGCYGSEVRTPNLDRLAANGVRFSQMYNAARCCPSRASLLTGVYPHQAGIGHMTQDLGHDGYRGYLSTSTATIAEVLRGHGYHTMMAGKWHVGGEYLGKVDVGDATHPVPTQRGFDQFYGILGGAGSYFNPPTMLRDQTPIRVETSNFYLTDAISDAAVNMVQESHDSEMPFFLYIAYTAPHWPLHALEKDIARYRGTYRGGWDLLRVNHHEQLTSMGILDEKWAISPRDVDAPPWDDCQNKEWEDLRMAVYAAQIDRVDQGIGRLLTKLDQINEEDNTLFMFLSDNGGCAELLEEEPDNREKSLYNNTTLDCKPIRLGNIPDLEPGADDTFMSYDLPWANASNSPFRLFKRWVHEGGISTPFVVHWPGRIPGGRIIHEPAHLIDIATTCFDASGVPPQSGLEGESLLRALEGASWSRSEPLVWEHEGNRAVRQGQWKLVREFPGDWELYDLFADRTELINLAGNHPKKVSELAGVYADWAARCGVLPWPPGRVDIGTPRGVRDHASQIRS